MRREETAEKRAKIELSRSRWFSTPGNCAGAPYRQSVRPRIPGDQEIDIFKGRAEHARVGLAALGNHLVAANGMKPPLAKPRGGAECRALRNAVRVHGRILHDRWENPALPQKLQCKRHLLGQPFPQSHLLYHANPICPMDFSRGRKEGLYPSQSAKYPTKCGYPGHRERTRRQHCREQLIRDRPW